MKQREQEREEEEEWRKATGGVSTQIISPSLTSLVATPNLPLPASYFTSTALEKAGNCLLGDFSFGNSFSRKLRDFLLSFFSVLSWAWKLSIPFFSCSLFVSSSLASLKVRRQI